MCATLKGNVILTDEIPQERALYALINGRVIWQGDVLKDRVVVFGQTIQSVVSREAFLRDGMSGDSSASVRDVKGGSVIPWRGKSVTVIDAKGNYISPGFINLHIHGCAGSDVMDATPEALDTMGSYLASCGVTGFLAATMTRPFPAIYAALDNIRSAMGRERGARILGAYMEGPFISRDFKGCQKEEDIARADFSLIKDYYDVIKVVVLAPETLMDDPGDLDAFVRQCRSSDIIVSMGHTAADYEQALAAIHEYGIGHVTHMFNAMKGFHHRAPGAVGAALESDVVCELIADNLHVHPGAQRLLYSLRGERMVLITDSMRACGMGDGEFELGGQSVTVKDGEARLADGTLAASVVAMNQALKNFTAATGCDVPEAVRLATETPAAALGMGDRIGTLEKGAAADITVFDDDFDIKDTFVSGRWVYKKEA